MKNSELQSRLAQAYKTGDACTPRKQALKSLQVLILKNFLNIASQGVQVQKLVYLP